MKRRIQSLLVAIFAAITLLSPVVVSAQYTGPFDEVCNDPGTGGSQSVVCRNRNNQQNPLLGPQGIFTRAITIIAWIIGLASVIVIVIAGLKYVTSAGDPKGVESAKNTIIYAAIGILIFIFAQAILYFVIRRL